MRDDQHEPFEKPGRLLENKSVGADVDGAWIFLLLCLKFAVVMGKDVEFDDF